MQQDRLDGWMVRQIENADLAKETVIQLPAAKGASKSVGLRLPAATSRDPKAPTGSPHRSITAVAGQETCSLSPIQPPRSSINSRGNESVDKLWHSQFRDRQQKCVESGHVDRTKVLHNMETKQGIKSEDSPLYLWGLPREHILDFIRQSVLPSSYAMIHRFRAEDEWEAVPDEEDEAEHVRRVVANTLALAPPKSPGKVLSPRAPTSPRSPNKRNDITASPRRPDAISPRISRATTGSLVSAGPLSPISPRATPQSEDRIHQLIADLRADPALWAAFQGDVERIHQQYRLKHNTCDKIRENKERAKTPRTMEENNQKKRQAEERMERTRVKREQIIHLEDKSKREAYLRHMSPSKQLMTAGVENTTRYRRRKMWLLAVSFAAISSRWHTRLIEAKHARLVSRVEGAAASTIQTIWRRWKWQHASKHTVVVYTWLRKCMWKRTLEVRCRRKTRHASLLRQFLFANIAESHATRNFKRVMLQWRSKVIRAQKAAKSFIHCTRARLHALSLWWDAVDQERQRIDRDDGRRFSMRKDSVNGGIGSVTSSAPGSAGARRKSIVANDTLKILGGINEKLANMQMLLTPIEIQRLQQNVYQVVKVPKSIKMQLLEQFLAESRKKFIHKQHEHKDQMLHASYAREVKLDEARAIVQNSASWNGSANMNRAMTRSGNISRTSCPPPCFTLCSDPDGAKAMEDLVRQGVQLTLDADPELRAIITRQQEQRLSQGHSQQSSRRSSVSFAGAAVVAPPSSSPSLSPSPRNSILKMTNQGSTATLMLRPASGRTTPNPTSRR